MGTTEFKHKQIPKWGFGMAPLSEVMQARYEQAVNSVPSVLCNNLSLAEVSLDSISELKGMLNRCIRQDQWDWFTVHDRLGQPSVKDLQHSVSKLSLLRIAISKSDWDTADKIKSELSGSLLKSWLLHFANNTIATGGNDNSGWIYILSTRENPTLLKIGMTTRSVAQRVKEINSATGVLYPYSARRVFRVKDAARAEKAIFAVLKNYRLRNDREFFHIPFSQATRIIDEFLKIEQMLCRKQGVIKWFSDEKGFGFITCEDNTDIFFHVTEAICDSNQTIKQGQKVEFDISSSPKGIMATCVVLLNA